MNRMKVTCGSSLVLMLLVLVGCSSDTPFQPGTEKLSQDQLEPNPQSPEVVEVMGRPTVPYHDEIFTTIVFVPPYPDPPTQPYSNFVIRGTGIASHMGCDQIFEISQLNVMTGVQTGTGIATGANGKELWYAYEGSGSDPDANGDLSFSGNMSFTGGTGIFEDASGDGTYHGTANVISNTGHRFMDADLTLSLPGRRLMNGDN